jgi:hypothetical protein
MRIEPDDSSAGIRLTGKFNPAIFTPDWLAKPDLVGESVNPAAEIKLIHPEVAVLESEWFRLTVTKERFSVDTTEAPLIRIADLTGRIFGNILIHTPIWHLVINRSVHFSAGTEGVQHQIGRVLAPLEPWGWWGERIEKASRRSGLARLTMESSIEEKAFDRSVVVSVSPSQKIRPGIGIHVDVDDRYGLPSAEKTIGCLEIISKLSSAFESSVKQSEAIVDQIMSLKERFK